MCRILIVGEFSSSLGGIKFESLKVYLIWNTSMLLLLNHFEFENQFDDTSEQRIFDREQGIFIIVIIAYHLTLISFNCDIKFDCCLCACRIIYTIFSFEWLRPRW